jgi:hypothetical protein
VGAWPSSSNGTRGQRGEGDEGPQTFDLEQRGNQLLAI